MLASMRLALTVLLLSGCYESHSREARDEPPGEVVPDRAWLAYSVVESFGDSVGRLYATHLGDYRTVTIAEGGAFWTAWSPTERVLAVALNDVETAEATLELLRFDDAGIVERRVVDTHSDGAIFQPEYSPDGRFILFERLTRSPTMVRRLMVYDIEGERTIPLTRSDHRIALWGPVGSVITFQDYVDGEDGLWLARSDEGMVPRRVPVPEQSSRPSSSDAVWSPDGSSLIFRADLDGEGWRSSGILTDARATEAVPFTPSMHERSGGASSFLWAPDSASLVYGDTGPTGEREWYLVRVERGVVSAPVSLSYSAESTLRWLSSTRLLKVVQDRARGTTELVYLDVHDERFTETSAAHVDSRCFDVTHAATSRIVLQCGHGLSRSLWWWEPGVAETRSIDSWESAFLFQLGWSPDATRLAFVGQRSSPDAFSLFEVSFPSGDVTELSANVSRWEISSGTSPPPWNPRGDAYFVNLEPNGLAIRDLASPNLHVVVEPGSEHPIFARGFERAIRD